MRPGGAVAACRPLASTAVVIDFTGETVGAFTPQAGVTLTRASVRSVSDRTGVAVPVVNGIASDTAGAGKTASGNVGALCEEARTTLIVDSRNMTAASWTGGTGAMTADYAVDDPTGSPSQLADRCNVGAAGFSNYRIFTGSAVPYSFTAWQRGTSGALTGQFSTKDGTTDAAVQFSLTTTWSQPRVTRTLAVSAACNFVPVDTRAGFGGTAVARDVVSDFEQIEAGAFPTEAIDTTTGQTRAGERWRYGTAANFVAAGRMHFQVWLTAKGAATAYSADMRVWTNAADATSFVEIDSATRVMTISLAGSTNTTTALNWAEDDEVEIYVGAGGGLATVVSYRVNGGVTVRPAITGSALAAYAPTGALDLLCSGTSNQLSCWIHIIRNTVPAWV